MTNYLLLGVCILLVILIALVIVFHIKEEQDKQNTTDKEENIEANITERLGRFEVNINKEIYDFKTSFVKDIDDDFVQSDIKSFLGLCPAWNLDLEGRGDVRFVWKLIEMDCVPLPLLLCPDERDFTCIVIVAEVEKT